MASDSRRAKLIAEITELQILETKSIAAGYLRRLDTRTIGRPR